MFLRIRKHETEHEPVKKHRTTSGEYRLRPFAHRISRLGVPAAEKPEIARRASAKAAQKK